MDTRTLKCLLTPIAAAVTAWPVLAQTASDPAAHARRLIASAG